jgi:hypothetical protein
MSPTDIKMSCSCPPPSLFGVTGVWTQALALATPPLRYLVLTFLSYAHQCKWWPSYLGQCLSLIWGIGMWTLIFHIKAERQILPIIFDLHESYKEVMLHIDSHKVSWNFKVLVNYMVSFLEVIVLYLLCNCRPVWAACGSSFNRFFFLQERKILDCCSISYPGTCTYPWEGVRGILWVGWIEGTIE